MRFLGFIGPSYKLRSVNVDCQRCIGWYPEVNELGTGKEHEVASLVQIPGKTLFATIGAGPIRAEFTTSAGRLFAVSGDVLYEVFADKTSASRGTLITDNGPVSISENGLQLFLADGANGYYFQYSDSTFVQVSDTDFPGADQVTYQDGLFVFNKPSTGQFFYSGLNAITFDALDIQTSEGNPDNIVGILSDHRELWVFNRNTTEVFYFSGGDPAFERNQGAFIEHGCAAPFSIQKMDNTVFWVGNDDKGSGIVFQAKGYQPQRISTHAVEYAIGTYGDISGATSYTYQQNGHHFYCLNFPTADTTWVFDSATNLWHERVYSNNGELERDRANCHAYAFAKHIVGDYANGNLYELSEDVNDDNGAPLIRKRTSPHIAQDMKSNFHSGLQLDMEVGTGLDGLGLGTDPQVMMRFSDDGGKTWSNEQWRSIGKIGQTKVRVKWWRLGSSRDRVYEISVTDPVRAVLIGAELDVVQGGS